MTHGLYPIGQTLMATTVRSATLHRSSPIIARGSAQGPEREER